MRKRFHLDGSPLSPTAAPDAAGLKWNKLFPFGTRYRDDFPGGRIDFTPEFFKTVLANWERYGRPALPCDYLHRGDCEPDLPVEDKVAAGWIESLELRTDGLWGGFKWTARAQEMISADELRFLSPTFGTEATDRLTGGTQGPTLYGAALLNTPFLQDLPRVAASAVPLSNPTQEKPVEFMAKLRTALGLGEAATEDECLTALAGKLSAGAPPPPAPAPAPEVKPPVAATVGMSAGDVEEVVKLATEPLKVSLAELQKENTKLKAERTEAAIVALSEKFRHKFEPAKRDEAVRELCKGMGLESATKFLSAMPDRVALGEKGISGDSTEGGAEDFKKYTAAVEAKAKELGIKFTDAARLVNREQPELANRTNRLAPTQKN